MYYSYSDVPDFTLVPVQGTCGSPNAGIIDRASGTIGGRGLPTHTPIQIQIVVVVH